MSTVVPMVTRRMLAAELLDYAVRFLRHLPRAAEGTPRDTCRRAGQILRLVSQQVNNQQMTVDEGVAWRDAARLTIERLES